MLAVVAAAAAAPLAGQQVVPNDPPTSPAPAPAAVPARVPAPRPVRAELTGSVGYSLNVGISASEGSLDLQDNISYAGSLGLYIRPGYQLEAAYSYTGGTVVLEDQPGGDLDTDLADISMHRIGVNGVREQPVRNSRVTPFVVGGIGMTILDSDYEGADSETRFMFSGGLGVKVPMGGSGRTVLKLQSRVYATLLSSEGAFWCGAGGCAGTISGTALWQFDFSGGLGIRF
jgi:hypothetical protein